jgi:hypothetical protein
MNTKQPRPYWLTGGTETCEVCEQPYVLQDEYRCAACDAAMCVHCIVEAETGDVFCQACRGEAEGDG